MAGRLESINAPRGGVPKRRMFDAPITEAGIDGDRQRDPHFHGGPDRAVVLSSLNVIRALQREAFLEHGYTRISQKRHPGWSRLNARVITGGLVAMGDAVEVASSPSPLIKLRPQSLTPRPCLCTSCVRRPEIRRRAERGYPRSVVPWRKY